MCPEISSSVQPIYYLRNTLGTDLSLEYISVTKSLAPSQTILEAAWMAFLVHAKPVIESQFGQGALPTQIRVIATDQIAPLGGLFCESVQKSPDQFTVFVNPSLAFVPQDFASQLAHEFVHAYFYHQRIQNPLWFEEGLALFLESQITGRPKGAAIQAHLRTPWTSLSDDFDHPENMLSAYGHAQLLFLYLDQQMGHDGNLIQKILATRQAGITALNTLIQQTPDSPWKNFREMFGDFEIAKRINRLDYANPDLTQQKRYFIFSTTLKAADVNQPSLTHPLQPLSSQVVSIGTVFNSSALRNYPGCFVVEYSRTRSIQIRSCKSITSDSSSENNFAIRVTLSQ